MNKQIKITVNDGQVMIAELYEDIAPKTVANFLSLVENKFYDGLTFHRVIPGFQTDLRMTFFILKVFFQWLVQ